ncbi:hypothetical protein [Acidocella sp.]|uniref:hypothetical protein n=1 Tax=Acidocella sp. TaxID=50710 RepID=UPI002627EC3E|nr:hypothetical protein [Acidocella sp.]MDD2795555.1 hypothetical protein [Acidocella sp.]
MLQQETTAKSGPSEAAALAERRGNSRRPVIRSAKIFVSANAGGGVFNCLILDQSSAGVLVDMGTLAELPDEVTLQMSGGASYLARRCWAAGTKAGLEFIGGQIVTEETSQRMARIAEVLQRQGVATAVATLRTARFLDHEKLRHIAEAAEAAVQRLEAALTGQEPI